MFIIKTKNMNLNPNESYTERKAVHELCDYSLDLVCSFDSKEKHSFYSGDYCIKKFRSELKELGTKVVNYGQKEATPLTSDDVAPYQSQKVCYICKRAFCYDKKQEDLNYKKK